MDDALCCTIVLPGRKSGFRAGFGRILVGKLEHRPSGRPKADRRTDCEVFPIRIREKSGPEARFLARKQTLMMI